MKFENTKVYNFQGAFHGMRNPMNSWDKSDSYFGLINYNHGGLEDFEVAEKWVGKFHPQYKNYPQNWDNEAYRLSEMYDCKLIENGIIESNDEEMGVVAFIGPDDMALAQKLIKAGPEHRKFLRQIFVSVDITAPLFFWKQLDTYKVSTVTNSTSTMHKLASTPITLDCFDIDDYNSSLPIGLASLSCTNEYTPEPNYDNMPPAGEIKVTDENGEIIETFETQYAGTYSRESSLLKQDINSVINLLQRLRRLYLETKDKRYWKELVRWLPEGWLQTRTWTGTYETIRAICSPSQRRYHKLNEWSGQDDPSKKNFIAWARTLPYAQYLIFDDENIPFQIEK